MSVNPISAMRTGNVYYYGNTHFNQAVSSPVGKVNKVDAVAPLSTDQDRLKKAESDGGTFGQEKIASFSKTPEEQEIMQSYQGATHVSYNVDSPYESIRKNAEENALKGMYFDALA